MKKTLLIIWQLPQSLAFAMTYLYIKIRKIPHIVESRFGKTFLVHSDNFMSSGAFGEFILLNRQHDYITVINHELGHCKQSLYLGWLYLIIVGVPSLTLNLLARKNETIRENYYTYFPENWADKLGGDK